MGRGPLRLPSSKLLKESFDYCDRFVMEARILEHGPVTVKVAQDQIHKRKVMTIVSMWGDAESWNMGRWPPRPPRSKFIRERADYCDMFVSEAEILEYRTVAAKAAQEQIHKGKMWLL